jgi:tetratricopeptide (TPR) repeat protein
MDSVGDRLRQARVARGLTQAQLAGGVATKGLISQIECNRTMPSLPRLRLLADRLGLPLSYFLEQGPADEQSYLPKAADLAIRAGEPARALDLVAEAERLSGADFGSAQTADLRRLRGVALAAIGRKSEAMAALQEAAAIAPGDEPSLNAAISVEIGKIHGDQERFNASIEANLRALRWLELARRPDLDLQARVLTNVASDYYMLGEVEQARRYYEQALAVATDAESLVRMANAHMALGVTARAAGDYAGAVSHCEAALAIHQRIGQHRLANQILNNLGDVYFAQEKVGEARTLQERCLDRGRELHDNVAVAAALCELARYALHEGATEDAIRLAREGAVAADADGNHVGVAECLSLEALAHQRRGNTEDSDECFRRSLELLANLNARGKLAKVAAAYSDALSERGHAERALQFMRMAFTGDFDRLEQVLSAT